MTTIVKNTLTLTQVSIHTGIDKRTLYRMIKDRRFSVSPIKGTEPRLWLKADVDKWLKSK